MISTTEEGFKILHGTNGVKEFMIDSRRLVESIGYIKRHNFRTIAINPFLGYEADNIDFLEDLADFLEGLIILDGRYDISVVNKLSRLKILGYVDNKKDKIDLANFPELRDLACEYSPRLVGLALCQKLNQFNLTNFKPKSHDLTELPLLPDLKDLALFVTNITSLAGIGRFPLLNKLEIFRAKNLQDINDLALIKNSLTTLELDKCKKISSYDVLSELTNCQRLLISDSHEISTLKFLKKLKKLEFFSFVGTNIVDGDLSYCVGIEYVGFDDKTHYSHRFKDFQIRAD